MQGSTHRFAASTIMLGFFSFTLPPIHMGPSWAHLSFSRDTRTSGSFCSLVGGLGEQKGHQTTPRKCTREHADEHSPRRMWMAGSSSLSDSADCNASRERGWWLAPKGWTRKRNGAPLERKPKRGSTPLQTATFGGSKKGIGGNPDQKANRYPLHRLINAPSNCHFWRFKREMEETLTKHSKTFRKDSQIVPQKSREAT